MSLVRRFGFIAYWIAFAVLALYEAQFPGYTYDLSEWRYPWRSVLLVWCLLAVLVAVLYLILRPGTFKRSWGRLVLALTYSAVLVYLGMRSFVTDMPGIYYVPAIFAVVTMGLVVIVAAVSIGGAVLERVKHAA